MLQPRTCRHPLIYRFNRGRERDLWKRQSDTRGCKLLDGNVLLGASVLCFAYLHKISSSQTVNTIWAGQIFTACSAPGGFCCHQQHRSRPGTSPARHCPIVPATSPL